MLSATRPHTNRPGVAASSAGGYARAATAAVLIAATLVGCGSSPASTRSARSARSPRLAPPVPGRLVLHAIGSLGQLPGARSGAAAAVLGSSIAVSGGLSADGESTSTVFLVSARGVLTSPSGLPAPVHDAAATAVGHRLLLFGGGQAEGSDEILQVLPRPARVIAALPQPLSDLDAVSISGVAYVVGGWNGSLPNRDIYSLRADGTTTRVGVLPVGVRYPAAAALDGELIVAGGETAAGGPTTSAWAFDPRTRALTRLPNLPAATDHTAGASVAGRFCVLGGERNGVFTDAIVCWAPGESHWEPAGRLPVPLADLRAVSFDDGVAVVGGRGSAGPVGTVTLLRAS